MSIYSMKINYSIYFKNLSSHPYWRDSTRRCPFQVHSFEIQNRAVHNHFNSWPGLSPYNLWIILSFEFSLFSYCKRLGLINWRKPTHWSLTETFLISWGCWSDQESSQDREVSRARVFHRQWKTTQLVGKQKPEFPRSEKSQGSH